MILLRRLSIFSRRHIAARAGLLAFGVALSLGTVLGLALAGASDRAASRKAKESVRDALQIGNSVGHGLEGSRKALKLLASVPSVVDRRGLETRAFSEFLALYPEFSYVGLKELPRKRAPKGDGPRPFRMSARIKDKGQKVYAVLKADWAETMLGPDERFGPGAGGTVTLLHSSRGLRTRSAAKPPMWRDLDRLKPGEVAEMEWADGQTYLTGVRRFRAPSATSVRFGVVTGIPTTYVAGLARRGKRVGLGFGVLLGLVAGTVAWVGIARSTRRLRLLNEALEGRVTERTAEALDAERSFQGIFENVPLGLYQCDPAGRFLRVNPTLALTLGYPDPEALLSGLGSLQAVGDLEERARFLDRLRSVGEVRGTTTLAVRADGRPVWLAESARAVLGKDGEILKIEGAMHDVTAQRELEDRLRRMGATDPLTLLLNRRGLEEAVEAADLPVSFVALDLDGFKGFNDAYGHPAGDRALQIVAEAIKRNVRPDDAVARAGGEEFVVVLPRTDAEAARRIAEGLRESVARCDILGTRLTVSGGVATAHSSEAMDEAFAAADRALYLAKEAGRDQIVVNPAKLA